MTFEEELLQILSQIPVVIEKAFAAFVERHPGHGNQKTHGNRFGGYSTTKESLRRLKNDKGEREKYKQRARKKQGKPGKAAGPKGEALSKSLDLSKIPNTPAGQKVRSVIAAIEKVHGVNGLEKLPVVMNSSTSTHGVYNPDKNITVTKNSWAIESTVAHEIGHRLDHRLFPPGDKFSSVSAKAGKDFDALDGVLQNSPTVKALQDRAKTTKHKYDEYLTKRHEIFARAYTQYVAVRSGDSALNEQVSELRKQHNTQWDDKEFEPIASALDKIFSGRGLR